MLEQVPHQGMAALVVGDGLAGALVDHAALALGPGDHALHGFAHLIHRDHLLVAARGKERGLVQQVGQVGAGETRGELRDGGEVDVLRERLVLRMHLQDLLAALCPLCRQPVAGNLEICAHGEAAVRQQSSHAALRDRRQHACHGADRGLSFCFTHERVSQFNCRLIAKGVGDDHERAAAVCKERCDIFGIELTLLIQGGQLAFLLQILADQICPLGGQLLQKPVLVQPFHGVRGALDAVLQTQIGLAAPGAERGMEEPVRLS